MCRARVGGAEACQKLFEAVLGQEHASMADGTVYLMIIDCYALQHPELRRPRSNAFHLLRLGWIILRADNPKIGKTDSDFRRYAHDLRCFPSLEPPLNRGTLTIADVAAAQDDEERKTIIYAWADAVWLAWSDHHAWVRETLGQG